MEQGRCLLCEGLYNGYGAPMGEETVDVDTGLSGLPAYVILNDAMTSDVLGESDVEELQDLQTDYNRLVSDDQDALRFNMFPQTIFTDASEDSVKAVKISPGALVDLQTDAAKPDVQARVEKLESKFAYHERFQAAKDDLLKDMYALMSCPQVTEDYLKAVGISGKAMQAMYWDLTCKCEERWASWDAALQWLVREIVEMEKVYLRKDWACDFTVKIEHLYPITEDEDEERRMDMQEVASQVRSRRSYIDKWQAQGGDPEDELKLIAQERQMLEEGYSLGE